MGDVNQLEFMHPLITQRRTEIESLCRQFGVNRLELFGSAATAEFEEERSDFDFLVEFDLDGQRNALEAYFGLKEGLEGLLGRPVDLVMPAAVKNPFLRAEIDRQRQAVYGT